MPVFVKASRRAKAYIRAGAARGSSIARLKKISSLQSKVVTAYHKPGTRNSKLWRLEKLGGKLSDLRSKEVNSILNKRFSANSRGLTGFNISKHRSAY